MTYFMAGRQLAGVERLMREGGECCPLKRLRDQAVADFFLTRNQRAAGGILLLLLYFTGPVLVALFPQTMYGAYRKSAYRGFFLCSYIAADP